MWSDFNLLAQWRPEHSAEPNPDLLARPQKRKVMWYVAPLLAAAVVALLLTRPAMGPAHSETAVAYEASGYRQEILPDGSRVEMNRGAHVVTQFSRSERRVLLIQGEAQFFVAKNAARPFVVRAGGMDVRAIGTAFNVKLTGVNLEVLVTEGKVQVAQSSAASAAPQDDLHALEIPAPVVAELTAGHRTILPLASVLAPPPITAASTDEIHRLLNWQPRLLDFNSTPLHAVVAEFNRRNVTQIFLADESLEALPIIASIRSDNVEGFVRLLEVTAGVRSERTQSGQILLRFNR
jgi:transmembrane sensor